MKKIGIYLLIIVFLFVTGCSNNKVKTAATLDDFESLLVEQSFTVSDNMKEYSGVDYVLESKKAIYDDIEIEMVKYVDSEYAKKVQDSQIESFNLLKSSGAFEKKEEGKNYYKYFLISNSRYMINARVDNTLIFCKTLLENKEKVEEIYNSLGY